VKKKEKKQDTKGRKARTNTHPPTHALYAFGVHFIRSYSAFVLVVVCALFVCFFSLFWGAVCTSLFSSPSLYLNTVECVCVCACAYTNLLALLASRFLFLSRSSLVHVRADCSVPVHRERLNVTRRVWLTNPRLALSISTHSFERSHPPKSTLSLSCFCFLRCTPY
jgi:hypothetical protein